jgi:AcrR family transcriptional regulator
MTRPERREQLVAVASEIFARKGFDATSMEEVAAKADISKPIVYQHFHDKEGLFAAVVEREMEELKGRIMPAITRGGSSQDVLARVVTAFLDFIDENPIGFKLLVRDSPATLVGGPYQPFLQLLIDAIADSLAENFTYFEENRGAATFYSQMLIGVVLFTGQWWAERHWPAKAVVIGHLVNLAWNGLAAMANPPAAPLGAGVGLVLPDPRLFDAPPEDAGPDPAGLPERPDQAPPSPTARG